MDKNFIERLQYELECGDTIISADVDTKGEDVICDIVSPTDAFEDGRYDHTILGYVDWLLGGMGHYGVDLTRYESVVKDGLHKLHLEFCL